MAAANPFRFAGGYLDSETGLTKFGTRYYDPAVGRWTQQDPLVGSLADPSTLNRYLYVHNDPVNLVDPSGLVPRKIRELLMDPKTYLGQALGILFGGAVGATCAAFIIGFTGGIGTAGTIACAVVGRAAGQWVAYQVRSG